MSTSRKMGAGLAGSSKSIRLNGDVGGGDKKQGLPSYTGRISGINYNGSYGNNRFAVFYMNQLGGIGKSKSMFITGADGVHELTLKSGSNPTEPPVSGEDLPVSGEEPQSQIVFHALNDDGFKSAITYYFDNSNQDALAVLKDNSTNYQYVGNFCDWYNQYYYISNWGIGADVRSMNSAFDMSNIKSNCYNGDASSFNVYIDDWNVGNITDMACMFKNASSFNQDTNSWDVSSVIDMSFMFEGATAFNGDLSNWDVRSVQNMSGMFKNASTFNRDLNPITTYVYSWDVSKVQNMANMFEGATAFNGDITDWDVGNVTDMSNMFNGATSFDQNIRKWKVGGQTNVDYMFYGATQMLNNNDYKDYIDENGTPYPEFFNQE